MSREIFAHYIPADGYDPDKNTLNGQPIGDEFSVNAMYITDGSTIIASLLGLPNRKLAGFDDDYLFLNLFQNFIGWRPNANIFANILLMPFMTTLNLILMPFKAALNITKVFTEYFPFVLLTIANSIKVAYEDDLELFPDNVQIKRKHAAAKIFENVFSAVFYLGRSITSPATQIRVGYNIAKDWGDEVIGAPAGFVMGLWVVFLHVVATVTVYSLVINLGIHFVATTILPALPAAVSGVINTVAAALEPVFSYIGFVAAQLNIASFAGATFISPAALGLSGLVTFTNLAAGKKMGEWYGSFKLWWHRKDPVDDMQRLQQYMMQGEERAGDDEEWDNEVNQGQHIAPELYGHSPAAQLAQSPNVVPLHDQDDLPPLLLQEEVVLPIDGVAGSLPASPEHSPQQMLFNIAGGSGALRLNVNGGPYIPAGPEVGEGMLQGVSEVPPFSPSSGLGRYSVFHNVSAASSSQHSPAVAELGSGASSALSSRSSSPQSSSSDGSSSSALSSLSSTPESPSSALASRSSSPVLSQVAEPRLLEEGHEGKSEERTRRRLTP